MSENDLQLDVYNLCRQLREGMRGRIHTIEMPDGALYAKIEGTIQADGSSRAELKLGLTSFKLQAVITHRTSPMGYSNIEVHWPESKIQRDLLHLLLNELRFKI